MKVSAAEEIEDTLLRTPCKRWKTGQVVILDWCDGPQSGIWALTRPKCEFYFELYTSKHNSGGLDDRLFLVSQLEIGTTNKLVEVLAPLGKPSRPIWTPIWRFPDEFSKRKAESLLDEIEAAKRQTGLVIRTRDMLEFTGCLAASRDIKKFLDWFEYKGQAAIPV